MSSTAYIVLLGEVENSIIHESYEGAVDTFITYMVDWLEDLERGWGEGAQGDEYRRVLAEVNALERKQEKVNYLVQYGVDDDFLHVGILEVPIHYDRE